jgi:hypothetical protein
VVSPAAYARAEASGSNAFPFGSTAPQFRYLNVHDDLAGVPRSILAFALRRGATTATSVTPAMSIVLDGIMSTATTTGATVSGTFDSNHGPDRTVVINNRTINFPAAGTGVIPYDFVYQVPLDIPFAFGGMGALCWEVQITARPAGASTFHDYVGGAVANPALAISRFGDGCLATGRTTPFGLTGASTQTWSANTGQLTATASDGPGNAPAVYLFGTSATLFGGLPLPFPLPNTSNGNSGVCYLNCDILLSLPGTLASNGSTTFRVDIPLFSWLRGRNLFGQVLGVDLAANALGLVSSNGVNHHIVAPHGAPPGGRVYASGSLGGFGTVGANQTLVVRFATM